MRRLVLTLGAALLLAGCAATAAPGGSATREAPIAEMPRYAVGDKWIRNDGIYDLVRIEDNKYVFAADNGREIVLWRDLTPFTTKRRQGMEWGFLGGGGLSLAWPLKVGNVNTSNGVVVLGDNYFHAQYESRVESWEGVRVPAGTFKAFRIVFSIEATEPYATPVGPRRRTYVWRMTTWYAPEVRQFVKSSGFSLGLLAYEVVAVDESAPRRIDIALADWSDPEITVASDTPVAQGVVSAVRGLRRVTVTLNDAEVFQRDDPTATLRQVDIDVPLKLREGKNVLLVTALDASGETRQEARVLRYEQPSAPPPVLMAPPGAGTAPVLPQVTPTPPVAAPSGAPPSPATPPPVAPPPVTPRPAPRLAAAPPLDVTITAPVDQASVPVESVGLDGVVSGGRGVQRVVVALNGQEVSRLDQPTPQSSVALNLPLRLRDGQNTLVVTATDIRGVAYQEVRTLYYERPTPFTVEVRFPEDRAKFAAPDTVLAAMIRSNKGIGRLSVTLNGTEVTDAPPVSAPRKSLALTLPLTLREGSNVIVVSASESDGTIRQVVRTVTYDARRKSETPLAAAPPSEPRRWAVVIGVGRYESRTIPRLRYAVPDAEALRDVLVDKGGFKPEHVLLLTDTTEKRPTYRNIKWALGTFLARSAAKEDTVVIFFAGHGAPEVDHQGHERDGLAKYLVPADADPDDLYATALPMEELRAIFGRIEAERVVVFIDACYSGAAGGRTFAAQRTRMMTVNEEFLERLARARGRAIITASRPSEVSQELAELGHGLFTYYLVEGLKGAADLNQDGIVSLQELYEYVEQRVVAKSRAVGGNQHPVLKGELEGVLPLVRVER